MHDELKAAVGITCANCETCINLGSDNDGGEPEMSVSWEVCNEHERYHFLKSFPFKKEMKCWEPDFWHSKFADEIKTGEDAEMKRLTDAFRAAVKAATPQPVAT